MARKTRWNDRTAGCECGCAVFSANANTGVVADVERIISAGPTPILPRIGCTRLSLPMRCHVNPLGGKTTNWRAGCRRSACPVRREGERSQSSLPTPISEELEWSIHKQDLKTENEPVPKAGYSPWRVPRSLCLPDRVLQ